MIWLNMISNLLKNRGWESQWVCNFYWICSCKKRLISSDCSWSLIFPLYKKERKSCFHCHKGIFSNIGSKILASVIIYGLSGVCLQQTERLFSDLGASSNSSGIDLQTDPFFDLKCSYVIILSVEDCENTVFWLPSGIIQSYFGCTSLPLNTKCWVHRSLHLDMRSH